MTFELVLLGHATKLAVIAGLLAICLRGLYRRCLSFVAYLAVIVTANSLVTFWPGRFYNVTSYVLFQAAIDVTTVAVGLELAWRVMQAFPGAHRTARGAVLLLLVITTGWLVAGSGLVAYPAFAANWQPRVNAGVLWLFTGTALAALWYRLPMHAWHRALLLGFIPYFFVLMTSLNLLKEYGGPAVRAINVANGVAYLALVVWWAYSAWRPEEELGVAPAVARRLGLAYSQQPALSRASNS